MVFGNALKNAKEKALRFLLIRRMGRFSGLNTLKWTARLELLDANLAIWLY